MPERRATPDRGVPARFAFFGSGSFGVPILDAVAAAPGASVVAVVSVPDRPSGRSARPAPPPVAERARQLGLAVLQPERLRDEESSTALRALDLDGAVLADYGRLVPQVLLDLPRRGFLNVHPSLLPRHRGATPIPATILAGDEEAGVSLFEMNAGLDTGPIVAQASWPLAGRETAPELEAAAASRGADLVAATLGPWLAGERPAVPQDERAASLSRPLRRDDGRLDPAQPATILERQVRAFQPWPGSFLETDVGRLVVLAAAVGPGGATDRPGDLVADADGLALATAEGRLRLLAVRPAGGRTMSSSDLRRGRPGLVGTTILAGAA